MKGKQSKTLYKQAVVTSKCYNIILYSIPVYSGLSEKEKCKGLPTVRLVWLLTGDKASLPTKLLCLIPAGAWLDLPNTIFAH